MGGLILLGVELEDEYDYTTAAYEVCGGDSPDLVEILNEPEGGGSEVLIDLLEYSPVFAKFGG